MGRKKIFAKTYISIPEVHPSVKFTNPNIEELVNNPSIQLPPNNFERRSLSFGNWYGGRIDAITYICQVQTLRFLAKQDAELALPTIVSMYDSATKFLDFAQLHAESVNIVLRAEDINNEMVRGFLNYLPSYGITTTSQKLIYSHLKSLLLPLGRRGVFTLVAHGISKTFPSNPFPNSNKLGKGALPLAKFEKKQTIKALRAAILPIWDDEQPLTSHLLAYCLLIVAFHTGRNTTPLREMTSECLIPHPKDNTYFLSLWKRRGHNTSKVTVRGEQDSPQPNESISSVRFSVERLLRKVIDRTAKLRDKHPEFQDCIWLYHSLGSKDRGAVTRLSPSMLKSAIDRLVKDYGLKDSNDEPLKLNISRLRKTFANRIFEILDGDIYGTAEALGNTTHVTASNYLAASIESKKKWRFMGEILVNELLTKTIGATYKQTPVAKCAHGPEKPNQHDDHKLCTSFLNCIRCKHFVVTADDLYKLFSFYFRIYSEREKMTKARWEKELSHIPRLIDQYVIIEGLRRGIFKQHEIDNAKIRARTSPHPFWSTDIIQTFEIIA